GRGAAPGVRSPGILGLRNRDNSLSLRNEIPKMAVRFTTTAGPHMVGATFPQTNLAPVLDLDQHFMRDTLQTGPTPGFTFFPHVGTVRIEGPFNAAPAKESPSRQKIFVCYPASAAEDASCARKIVGAIAAHAFRRPVASSELQ